MTTIDTSILARALELYFDDVNVASYELMAHGRENISIKLVLTNGRELLLRIWGEEHSHIGKRKLSDITGELAFMIRCHESGLPVPKVYASKHGEPYAQLPSGEYFVVMDFVPGTSPQALTPAMTQQIAGTMAQMHLLATDFAFPEPRSWLGSVVVMTEQALQECVESTELDQSLRDYLRDIREVYRSQLQNVDLDALPAGPIHGDIFWENLKFEGEKLTGLFDFDDCRTSYFLEHIFKTLLFDFDDPDHSFYGDDGSNIGIFVSAYLAERPLTDVEWTAVPGLFAVSYAYRLATYIRRLLRGNTSYETRIPALMESYDKHKDVCLAQISQLH